MTEVVVFGMHHSGTSLVAQLLHRLGVHMGDNLLRPNDHNPWGHWEDREFLGLNKRILNTAGGDWQSPPAPSALRGAGRRLEDNIEAIVAIRQNEHDVWGWKDPRNCLTLGLYHSHLNDPRYVYVRRVQAETASSLRRYRPGLPDNWGKLIKVYRERIDGFVRENWPLELHTIWYDQLMQPEYSRCLVLALALFVGADASMVDRALECIKYK